MSAVVVQCAELLVEVKFSKESQQGILRLDKGNSGKTKKKDHDGP